SKATSPTPYNCRFRHRLLRRHPDAITEMTSQRYDPEVIDEHVTAMLRRLKSSRRDYVHRLRRFGRAAEVLLKPRGAVFLTGHPETGLTAAEVYGGLWLILISDVFRDEDQRAA